MKFGVQIPPTDVPFSTLKDIVMAMDRGRWNSYWTFDHLVPPMSAFLPQLAEVQKETDSTPDGWTQLSALAALTKRIRLGNLVSSMTFRHPAILAKIAASIDEISNGRVELGIGAGWHEREHQAYGVPFYTTKERLDRLEEGAQYLRLLLTQEKPVSMQGRFFELDNAPFSPRGVQQPHIPILIGGGGEKRTLRTVALYGDATNLFGNFIGTIADIERKFSILEAHCAEVGRDPGQIRRTVGFMGDVIDDEAKARRKREFLSAGIPTGGELPIGKAQRLIDTIGPFTDPRLRIDEIILFGLTPTVETFQQVDEQVIGAFAREGAVR